jgi:hypothetical protein
MSRQSNAHNVSVLDALTTHTKRLLRRRDFLKHSAGTPFWENNIFIYSATRPPNRTKEFLLEWLDHNKPLWIKGGNDPLPIRGSFYQDPLFNNEIVQAIVVFTTRS